MCCVHWVGQCVPIFREDNFSLHAHSAGCYFIHCTSGIQLLDYIISFGESVYRRSVGFLMCPFFVSILECYSHTGRCTWIILLFCVCLEGKIQSTPGVQFVPNSPQLWLSTICSFGLPGLVTARNLWQWLCYLGKECSNVLNEGVVRYIHCRHT